MDVEQQRILNEIAGLGSPEGLDSVQTQLAAARLRQAKANQGGYAPSGGSGQVPQYGKFVRDQVQGRLADQDVLALQQQEAQALRRVDERTSKKPMVVPYGGVLASQEGKELLNNERLPGSVGGGQDGLLQIADRIKAANPGMDDMTAIETARDIKRRSYSTATVANVEGKRDNMTGAFTPDTNIETVAGNAGEVKASEAEGGALGKGWGEQVLAAPSVQAAAVAADVGIGETIAKIDELKAAPLGRMVGLMSYFPTIRGSSAANAEKALDSLSADLGLKGLLALKAQGGTLGQVAIKESEWLQSAIRSLALEQSEPAFRNNLQQIRNHMVQVRKDIANAAKAATTRQGLSRSRTQPAPAQPASNDPFGIR